MAMDDGMGERSPSLLETVIPVWIPFIKDCVLDVLQKGKDFFQLEKVEGAAHDFRVRYTTPVPRTFLFFYGFKKENKHAALAKAATAVHKVSHHTFSVFSLFLAPTFALLLRSTTLLCVIQEN